MDLLVVYWAFSFFNLSLLSLISTSRERKWQPPVRSWAVELLAPSDMRYFLDPAAPPSLELFALRILESASSPADCFCATRRHLQHRTLLTLLPIWWFHENSRSLEPAFAADPSRAGSTASPPRSLLLTCFFHSDFVRIELPTLYSSPFLSNLMIEFDWCVLIEVFNVEWIYIVMPFDLFLNVWFELLHQHRLNKIYLLHYFSSFSSSEFSPTLQFHIKKGDTDLFDHQFDTEFSSPVEIVPR